MIWVALIFLFLIASSIQARHSWALAIVALCVVGLVALHLWASGAIP